MPDQSLDYGRLVERALRQVVREALGIVAERGLPGRHHHYITFRTDHPGVGLADDLRARYPTEMTIVLQNEFWGLEVGEDRFAVGLSFGGVPHRLEIPLDAVTMFADPSVEFGLQFAKADAASTHGSTLPAAPVETPGEARRAASRRRRRSGHPRSLSQEVARRHHGCGRAIDTPCPARLDGRDPVQRRSLTMSRDRSVRVETDTFGPIEVPADRYWGAQTQRSLQNFRIGTETMPLPLVRALGIVKQAAAVVNREQGHLEARLADAIVRAAQEVATAPSPSTFRWWSGRPAPAPRAT